MEGALSFEGIEESPYIVKLFSGEYLARPL